MRGGDNIGITGGFIIAFMLSILLGSPLISALRLVGVKQTVSEDAPSSHASKQGTPTMGGLLILLAVLVPVVLNCIVNPGNLSALSLLGLTLAFGAIGFLDDYLIATKGKNLGLKARHKL